MTTKNEKQRNNSELSYDGKVDMLATRYMDRSDAGPAEEFKETLARVQEQDEAWRAEGFDGAGAYLTPDGELISIGRFVHPDEKDGTLPGYYWEHPHDQTYRVFHNGELRDVTVPKQFAGTSMSFRGSKFESMYNIDEVVPVDENNVTPEDVILGKRWKSYADLGIELTEDMEWLHDRFGGKAMRSSGRGSHSFESPGTGEAVSLEDVVLRTRAIVNAAHEEANDQMVAAAYEEASAIERQAVEARAAVKKVFFESAAKLAERQEAAYRDSIRASAGK